MRVADVYARMVDISLPRSFGYAFLALAMTISSLRDWRLHLVPNFGYEVTRPAPTPLGV
jgi:multisubunit Na+/H+ antiporter MnhG subunit